MTSLPPRILAIETSCDDTSVAITTGPVIMSSVVASQTQLHKQYGGVFPTVAKQAHKENIQPAIYAAYKKAHCALTDIDVVAVTQGPGLAPALEVGIQAAKQIALDHHLPLLAMNHVEGHLLSPLLCPQKKGQTLAQQLRSVAAPSFPMLGIIVSGNHTEFVHCTALGQYQRIGMTVDDAAGEALDKFGRMIDIGYPAGAVIEEFAKKGNPHRFVFPLPMTTSGDANMSFSGLKTFARNLTEKLQAEHALSQHDIYDLCASFQYAVFKSICYKLNKVLPQSSYFGVWLGGGVSANVTLRHMIRKTLKPYHLRLHAPYHKRFCADNATMIGLAAGELWQRLSPAERAHAATTEHINAIERNPRWQVDEERSI